LDGADVETLTRALRAPNLVLRALAANELADRFGAATAQAALAQATAAGGIEALPAALALNRVAPDLPVGLPADVSDVAASLRTLRVLADRGSLGERERAWVTRVAAEAPIGQATRAMADLFVRRPEPWQADLILRLQPRVPAGDTELIYALRLALKAQLARAADADLAAWGAVGPGVDAYIADVAVAVPSPVSAAFLLGHLERTAFAGERAGEFARHAVRHLPPEQLEAAVGAMIRSLEQAPLAQRLALAEGLSSTLVQNRRALPDSVRRWMVDTLLEITPGADVPLARRAAEALREPSLPEKVVPLTAVAGRIDLDYGVRLAAARGLPAGNPAVLEMLGRVARRPEEAVRMRRIAVIQLGTVPTVAAAREHLAAALPGAPVDLSLAIATELARTNEGAKALMDAVDAGKAPPLLLRHRDLANALAARDASVRERAERLTAALPPEDARLDAVIAERNGSFAAAVKDLHRGAAVFAQNCAACHRIGGTGGNLGPNLDGIGVRGASRLIEDILDPSRNVDPVFRLASVTLRNGETAGGMDLREEGSELRVVDPATGTERRFAKADVVSHAVLASSAMPAAFESALSEQEFHDLLAYLLRPSA
jgi:putative heme-binding domain-containing protein